MNPHPEESYFGRYLVGRGIVSEEGLRRALAHQEDANRRLGAHAMEMGLLDANQVQAVIDEQQRVDKPFGAIALAFGFLTPRQLDNLLFTQTVHSTHLGEAMLDLGLLTPRQFDGLLGEYNAMRDRKNMEIGYLLENMAEHAMLRAVRSALERAFSRFAGMAVRLLSVSRGKVNHAARIRVDVRVLLAGEGWVESTHLFSEEFALALAGGFTGRHPDKCREDCLHRLEDFFAIMERYLASTLAGEGHEVAESTVRVTEVKDLEDDSESCVTMQAVTSQGSFGLRVAVATPRGKAGTDGKRCP